MSRFYLSIKRSGLLSTGMIIVTLIVILFDQISKTIIDQAMSIGKSVSVIGEFFKLTYVRNPGAAFGVSFGSNFFHLILSLVALVFIIVLLKEIPPDQKWSRFALSLIFGGAIGNLIDRVRLDEVIDFLEFGIGRYRWPVFNLADVAVSLGVFGLIVSYMLGKERPKNADDQLYSP